MKKSQLKIGAFLSYISLGLNMIIQLLYTPIMIRLLGQSEYGLYTLVGSVVSYLSLFSLGFTGAYLRFYTRSKGDNTAVSRLNGIFLTLFLLMGAAAFCCGMVLTCFPCEIFGSNLTEAELQKATVLMRILVVNIALTFPNSVFDSMISAKEQFIFQKMLQLLGIVFNPLITLPLLILGYGSVAVVCVTTVITICKLAISIWYCIVKLHIPVVFGFHRGDFTIFREIGVFSFFIFLNMLIDQANWSVDKYILGRISGTAAVAVYGVGNQIVHVVLSFSTAISSVFNPRVNRIAVEEGEHRGRAFTDLMIKVGRIQFMVLGLIVSGFTVFGYYFIVNIYATKEYSQAYFVVLLCSIPLVIPLIQNVGIEVQRAVNKHQFRSIIYFFMALSNVIMSIPLAKRFGPIGCSLGTGLSLLVANGFIMNVYYHKALEIDIPRFWHSIGQVARGLVLPVLLGSMILWMDPYQTMIGFLGWIVIYTGVYALSMWCFGMNDSERALIINPLKKVLHR